MNQKDASVIAVLAKLGLREEPKLTPEQEFLLQQASDPEQRYWLNLKRLFCPSESSDDNK